MMRTHRAGDLRVANIDEAVVVCGWVANRRDHGGKVFLDVRDAAGLVQGVVDPALAGPDVAHRGRAGWGVRVRGVVQARREGRVNTDLPTGEIEVVAASLKVLNGGEPPPFPLDDRVDVD